MKSYFFNILLGLDLFASTLTGGIPGETLSGRAGSAQEQGKLRGRIVAPIINFIMGSSTHCHDAIAGDVARAKAVVADDSRT